MRLLLSTVLSMSLIVLGSRALAQTASSKTQWLKAPSSADVVAVFPRTAAHLGHSGKVQLSCTIQPDGGLTRCDVLSEDPGDEGFGDAALKLSKLYKLASPDGSALPRNTIVFPVSFPLAP